MRKKPDRTGQTPTRHLYDDIPDIDIIDLDMDSTDSISDFPQEPEEDIRPVPSRPEKFRINMHILLLAAAVIFIGVIAYRITHYGKFISQEDIFKDGQGNYEAETYDEIMALLDENQQPIPLDYSDGLTILAFGNAPFADDRDSKDSLANLIAQKADATVINCAVSDSYLASQLSYLNSSKMPMDTYTFYWLCALAVGAEVDDHFTNAAANLGDDVPPDAEEVYNTIKNLDMNTVDAVVVMYDANDYLMGNPTYDPQNPTNIMCVSGNLEAGIELLQKNYPNIRIIIMSVPYAYAIDDNGEYVSSEKVTYGDAKLSDYFAGQYYSAMDRSVSFVDNMYGTFTEENADEYLSDNIHLNVKGRRLLADRFVETLTYFDSLIK